MNYEYCNGHMHTIKKGDTLYALSRRYHVPLEVMLRANPYVDVYNLQPGDTVCIPGKKADGCSLGQIMPRMDGGQEQMAPDGQENMADSPEKQGQMPQSSQEQSMASDGQESISETSFDTVQDMTEGSAEADNEMKNDRSEEDQEIQSHEMTREFDTTVPYDNRYVTERGDSLQSFLQRMNVSLNDFLEQNAPKDIMLLPGVAYRK